MTLKCSIEGTEMDVGTVRSQSDMFSQKWSNLVHKTCLQAKKFGFTPKENNLVNRYNMTSRALAKILEFKLFLKAACGLLLLYETLM